MKMILTMDEVQALQGIKDPALGIKTSLVPDLSKRLAEHGYVKPSSDGHLTITEIGRQALFNRHCFNELLAFSKNPRKIIQLDCKEWLNISGFIHRKSGSRQLHPYEFEITQKGWDWIAYCDSADGTN